MKIKKKSIIVIFLFIALLINSLDIKVNIISNVHENFEPFSFINNEQIIHFNIKKILILNIKNNKIIKKNNTNIQIIPEYMDNLNNKIILTRMNLYDLMYCKVYDLNKNDFIDISQYFKKEFEIPLYWSYYSNNNEIIYYYRNLDSYENSKLKEFGIYKKNLITKKNIIIADKSEIIDCNKGLLLYFSEYYINEKDTYKVFIFDEKQNKTTFIEKWPNIPRNNLRSNVILFKDNNFLWIDDNSNFKLIEFKTGNIYNIKLLENISIFGFKYNFDSDLIGINYNDKKGKRGFLVIKIDVAE